MADLVKAAKRTIMVAGDGEKIEAVFSGWVAEAAEVVATSGLVPAVLEDPGDARDAAQAASWAQGALKRVESQRKAWSAPVRGLLAAINARCREVSAPLEGVTAEMKRRIGAYTVAQERRAAEERRALAAGAKGRKEAAWMIDRTDEEMGCSTLAARQLLDDLGSQIRSTAEYELERPPTMGQASVRRGWVWRVVDPSAVPRMYLVVDAALLNGYTNRRDTPPAIPGVEWTERAIVAVRAGD